jgi:hypothetical protein
VKAVRVVNKKTVWHQRLADRLLRVISFGQMSSYLTSYVTTLGRTVYVPDGFEQWPPLQREQVMRHELVHVAQFERYGWPLMVLVYGLLPFPVIFAYGRARLEWEAYEETLRAVCETESFAAACSRREEIVRRFTGPDYLWMWPFPKQVNRWIDRRLEQLKAGP